MPVVSQSFVSRLVIAAVVIGFLTLLGVGVGTAVVLRQNVSFTEWVTHTYEVESEISEYRILNERVETVRRGYLLARDPAFLGTYQQAADALPMQIEVIRRLTADNPVQQRNIARLRTLMTAQIDAMNRSLVTAGFAGDRADNRDFERDPGVERTRDIRVLTAAMSAEEQRLLKLRDLDRLRALDGLYRMLLAAGVFLPIVAAGSIFTIVRYTRDLTSSRDELRQLNEGLEAQVNARTFDLQRANDEIQRFAYIVSHDLRSPLVNVMGFTSELEMAARPLTALIERVDAEAPALANADARRAVQEDLPEAIGFIRTSTQKMDRLINAILQLSRQGRRVLAPERIDMRALMGGIADNLKHRQDELGATITVDPDLPAIVSDRLALEQVFANLVENALKYLKPGRPGKIVIRGQAQAGRVVFEIEDNGRGIDPRDHERVFELFRRSGTQDQPGEGIGLAHVRALAYRLGGTVSVDSTLDRGARFRVSLPLALTPERAAA